jgi:hypothetical protein
MGKDYTQRSMTTVGPSASPSTIAAGWKAEHSPQASLATHIVIMVAVDTRATRVDPQHVVHCIKSVGCLLPRKRLRRHGEVLHRRCDAAVGVGDAG